MITGLKEAYQPSNVVLDIWFLRGEEGGSCYRLEKRTYIKLQADNAEESWLTGLGGDTVVASLGNRKTNLILL